VVSVTHLVNAILHLPASVVYVLLAALAFGESAAFLGLVLPERRRCCSTVCSLPRAESAFR
jgi:hypothetical protein